MATALKRNNGLPTRYYDDPKMVVVVTPVRTIGREWRYVVVDRRIVAGSAYEADGRVALADDPGGRPWAFASEVAAGLDPPEAVYVLDICEADGRFSLLELNPFSGADPYAFKPEAVVAAVSEAAQQAVARDGAAPFVPASPRYCPLGIVGATVIVQA